MRNGLRTVGWLALAALLAACSDDVVGEWDASTGYCADQARDHFTIEDDLTGTGQLVMQCDATGSVSLACAASLTAIERQGEGRWQLEADMGYCDAVGEAIGRAYKDCQLRSDGGELRCCNPDGTNCLSYTRVE